MADFSKIGREGFEILDQPFRRVHPKLHNTTHWVDRELVAHTKFGPHQPRWSESRNGGKRAVDENRGLLIQSYLSKYAAPNKLHQWEVDSKQAAMLYGGVVKVPRRIRGIGYMTTPYE